MNLFRSKEHVRNWADFNPESEPGLISLPDLAQLFAGESRRHLLDGDYLEFWASKRGAERLEALQRVGKSNSWWLPTG